MQRLREVAKFIRVLCFTALLSGVPLCGIAQNDTLITPDGAGKMAFGERWPNFGRGYRLEEVHEIKDGRIVMTTTVLNLNHSPGIEMIRTGEDMIEVFSPRYRTAEGIYAGMKIADALELMGCEVSIDYNSEAGEFIFSKDGIIGFVVSADDLKDRERIFEDYTLLRDTEITAGCFKCEAAIAAIRIYKKENSNIDLTW